MTAFPAVSAFRDMTLHRIVSSCLALATFLVASPKAFAQG